MAAPRRWSEGAIGEEATGLRLAVTAGPRRPPGRVGRGHRVEGRVAGAHAQRAQVVTPVAVELDDLVGSRTEDVPPVARLLLDERAQSLGVDLRREDVGAAVEERRERHDRRRDVEQRTTVQVRVLGRQLLQEAHECGLLDEPGLGEERTVGTSAEGRGVEHERRSIRTGAVGPRVRPRRAQQSLVVAVVVSVVADPHRPTVGSAGATRPADVVELVVLPHDDARRGVVDDPRELVGAPTPVERTEDRAEPCARDEAFEDAVAVVSVPQDARAGFDTVVLQDGHHTVDALGKVARTEAVLAADDRERVGPEPCVLAQRVRERQVIHDDLVAPSPWTRSSRSVLASVV